MKRVLNFKEKIATISFSIITILLSILISRQTTDTLIAQTGIDMGADLGLSPIILITIVSFSGLIGLFFGALILFFFIKMFKIKQYISYGFIYFIYSLNKVIQNILIVISIFIFDITTYLQYNSVFTLILKILEAILIASLCYKFNIVNRNKALIIMIIITIVNLAITMIPVLMV